MDDDDVGKPQVGGDHVEEALQGLDAAGRGTNPTNGDRGGRSPGVLISVSVVMP
jgi:hypothetical protein